MQNPSRKSAFAITMVVVAVVLAILVLFTIQGWNIRQEVSESKVSEATRAVREKYLELSAPVSRDLSLLAKWGEAGVLDIHETRQLNDKFMPLLESQTMVSSLILTDTDGREYFLLREKASWLTRSSEEFRPGMKVNLKRWSTAGDLLKTWREKRTFDPRNRTWFAGALQSTGSGTIFRTEPYRFKTVNKLGITASVRWHAKSDDRVITVAALDILLDDLYQFLSGLQVSPGARILMIRNDGSLMVPRKANQSQKTAHSPEVSFISSGDLEEGLFKDAMGVWEKARTETFAIKKFSSEGKTWWVGFKPMHTDDSGSWIGVIIPQKDLTGNFRQRWLHVVLIVAAILFAGSVLIVYLIRHYSHRYPSPPATDSQAGSIDDDLLKMISAGEGSNLEFKSTLRTNLKTGKTDKAIELAWLKSVAAFMNSEGGTLLIGINDNSGIEGIEADGFESDDKCRLHLKNLLNQHIGAEFSRYINCDLQTINGKTIVVITCEKVSGPVFLAVGKNEDFFIRSGPSSIRLSMSKMVKYLQQRK